MIRRDAASFLRGDAAFENELMQLPNAIFRDAADSG
jgi:hypothetical protein